MTPAQTLARYFATATMPAPVWVVFDTSGTVLHFSTSKREMQERIARYQTEQATSMWLAKVSS